AQRGEEKRGGALQRVLEREGAGEGAAPHQGEELRRRLAEEQKKQREGARRERERDERHQQRLERAAKRIGRVAPGRGLPRPGKVFRGPVRGGNGNHGLAGGAPPPAT